MSIEDEMVDLYLQGNSKRSIYKKYNTTKGKFNRILKNRGIPLEKQKITIDMSGQIIGSWKVLHRSKIKVKGKASWLCLCLDCNQEYNINGDTLRLGKSHKCKNCHIKHVKKRSEGCCLFFIARMSHGARKRNLLFSVDRKYLNELFEKQSKKCILSGLDIHFGENGNYRLPIASLDRINCSEGYVDGNVRWVHKDINQIRWNLTDKNFLYFIDLISNFNGYFENDQYIPILNNKGHRWKGFGNISSKFFNSIKNRSKYKNIIFDLKIEDIWNLYIKQKEKCNLTGLDIYFDDKFTKTKRTASLDRIDSSLGYTLDNVQWLNTTVNYMKFDYKQDYFINICKIVDDYQKRKEIN